MMHDHLSGSFRFHAARHDACGMCTFLQSVDRCGFRMDPLEGWKRSYLWNDLGRRWMLTSPNMPGFDSCVVFPGMVVFEGTNISEGRGTTLPFLYIGAPFYKAEELVARTKEYLGGEPPGLVLRPASFQPSFQKWAGQPCEGLN